jgi:hypothetical protein
MHLHIKITPFIAGLATGLWAAVAVGLLSMNVPEVYGICGISHPRDLINFVINNIFGTNLSVSKYSLTIPVLTYVGIAFGSFVSALHGRELRLRTAPEPASSAIFGFAVANFGMLMGYCSVRAVMLLAYGNLLAIPGLTGIIAGSILACRFVRWKVRRE